MLVFTVSLSHTHSSNADCQQQHHSSSSEDESDEHDDSNGAAEGRGGVAGGGGGAAGGAAGGGGGAAGSRFSDLDISDSEAHGGAAQNRQQQQLPSQGPRTHSRKSDSIKSL